MHFIRSNVAIIDGDLDAARRLIDESLAFTDMLNAERVAAVFGAHHLVAALIDGTVGGLLDAVRELATDQPGVGAWHAARAAAAAGADRDDEALEAIRFVLGDGTPNLQPDPTYTAGLIALGEAAAQVGSGRADSGDRGTARTACRHLVVVWVVHVRSVRPDACPARTGRGRSSTRGVDRVRRVGDDRRDARPTVLAARDRGVARRHRCRPTALTAATAQDTRGVRSKAPRERSPRASRSIAWRRVRRGSPGRRRRDTTRSTPTSARRRALRR